MFRTLPEKAKIIRDQIISNADDRGLLNGLDDDILEEIEQEWKTIVFEVLVDLDIETETPAQNPER